MQYWLRKLNDTHVLVRLNSNLCWSLNPCVQHHYGSCGSMYGVELVVDTLRIMLASILLNISLDRPQFFIRTAIAMVCTYQYGYFGISYIAVFNKKTNLKTRISLICCNAGRCSDC